MKKYGRIVLTTLILPFLSRSAPTIAEVERKLGWWCSSTRKSRSFKRDITVRR